MSILTHIVKSKYIFTATAYSLFLYAIFWNTGIITVNEAEKYIAASQEIAKGNIAYTFKHYLFYSSYIFFITPFISLIGITATVFAQAVLNFIAAVCIKRTIDIILSDNKISFLGPLIFLFSYPVQYWTLTLFSDNFFITIICITLYYTLKKKTKTEFIFWTFLLAIQVFTRPPGVFITASFGCYYLYDNKILSATRVLILTAITMTILIGLLFYIPVETKGYIKPIAAGSIIVDKPDYNIPKFNGIEKSTLREAYAYLVEKKGVQHTIHLYFRKLCSFFILTRPYYSKLNNSILSAHYLLYAFAIAGLFIIRKKAALFILFLSCMILISNLTALTYNEWHYRFTLAIFPYIIILSVISVHYIKTAFSEKLRKK